MMGGASSHQSRIKMAPDMYLKGTITYVIDGEHRGNEYFECMEYCNGIDKDYVLRIDFTPFEDLINSI